MGGTLESTDKESSASRSVQSQFQTKQQVMKGGEGRGKSLHYEYFGLASALTVKEAK